MAVEKILGSDLAVKTRITYDDGNANRCTVVVEGKFEDLESSCYSDVSSYLPADYVVDNKVLMANGDGFGSINIRCVKPGDGSGLTTLPDFETWSVDMAAVTKSLQSHPKLEGKRWMCEFWLNTDPLKRVDPDGETFYYCDTPDGEPKEITDEDVNNFCRAHVDGITTYNEYLPVVNHISTYKRLPGASMNEKSTTSGQAKFSDKIGKFDDPALLLQGYGSGHWFKSGDRWQQNADQSWTRTEEWTYTPDTSSTGHGWIYEDE